MTTLGEIVEASPEKIDPADNPDSPYVGLEHIESGTKRLGGIGKAADVRSAKSVFRAGDVLFGKLRPYLNKVVRPDFDGVCSTDILVLRATERVDSAFIEQLVSRPQFIEFAMAHSAGINLPRTSYKKLAEYPVCLPPLPEQRRIIARLDALMARSRQARAKLAEVPAQLTQARQSLLAAAFRGGLTAEWRTANKNITPVESTIKRVRFEASRTGRSASDEKIPGIAALSVGDIGNQPPRKWIKIPLLNVARLESGHTPSRQHSEYWGGRVPWISIPDARLYHGKTISKTASFTNKLGLANSAARLLPKGTVCLSRTASVGYVTIMGRPMSTSQDFANWICSEALLPEFLMLAFLAEGDHLRSFGRGTTHTTIYYPELKALHILLPSIPEQREIVRRLTAAFAKLDAVAADHTSAVTALDHLDQSLLSRAFVGRLVPQSKDDEPVAKLLSRIAKAAMDRPVQVKPKRTQNTTRPKLHKPRSAMQKSRHDPDVKGQRYLAKILQETKSPLDATKLFERSQLPLADFYKQLGWEVANGYITDSKEKLEAIA